MQLKNMAWSAAVILISTALYAQDKAFVKNEASNRPVSGFTRKQANIAPGQGKRIQLGEGHKVKGVAKTNALKSYPVVQKRTSKAAKAPVRVSKSKSPRNGPVLNTYTNKRGTMVQLKGGAR